MSDTHKLIPFRAQSESFTVFKDEGCFYVDKTDFIRYMIERGDKIVVCTRPRRFGKTLMLRMLQTFFEYAHDRDGNLIDNRHYFEGLKVMEAGENVLKHMGQYPVISLSLKDVSGDTYESVVEMMRKAVYDACQPHLSLLLDNSVLLAEERELFKRYASNKASDDELKRFLGDMSVWLNRITNRKVVILLDEYDVPLQQAAIYDNHHPNSDMFEKTVRLIGRFVSAGFKSNNNLAFGIITGCMRVAKESIFTGMNNPGVITVVDDIPNEYWGFTQKEVADMLAYYGLSDQMDALKYWYDGYYYSDREVYNPWSLLNAIRGMVNGNGERAIQSYWAMTSSNDIIDDMIDNHPQYREELARLMNGATKRVPVYKDLSYRDLKTRTDAIWSFLLYTGYLKSVNVEKNSDDFLEADVMVPNREIIMVMKSAMQHWWKDIRLAGFDVRPLMSAMWNGDVATIEREINDIMSDSISVKDAKEDFYHGMMVGVLRTKCIVKSNRESGEGFPDIVAMQGNHAAILELKCLLPSVLDKIPRNEQYAKAPGMMQKLLDEAEEQIRTRHYIESLQFDYPLATDVKSYAVCFCRKMCKVRLVKI